MKRVEGEPGMDGSCITSCPGMSVMRGCERQETETRIRESVQYSNGTRTACERVTLPPVQFIMQREEEIQWIGKERDCNISICSDLRGLGNSQI